MHPCAIRLEEAFACLAAEEAALDEEDLEKTDALAAERAACIRHAWQARDGFDAELLRQRLLELEKMHGRLVGKAEALRQSLHERQSVRKKQSRYFNAERHIHAEAKRSLYCDKRS
jgi:hypothetical protein